VSASSCQPSVPLDLCAADDLSTCSTTTGTDGGMTATKHHPQIHMQHHRTTHGTHCKT
jgi:hypothetical protein